jgi:hypothetical protein
VSRLGVIRSRFDADRRIGFLEPDSRPEFLLVAVSRWLDALFTHHSGEFPIHIF